MAKLTKKEIEQIVRRDAPGHRIVNYSASEDAAGSIAKPDEGTPSMARLKSKYLGDVGSSGEVADSADETADELESSIEDQDETEDQMVAIEPQQPPSPWDHGSRAKVVVISGKEKRIIASQG